jgi:hypothetical protein
MSSARRSSTSSCCANDPAARRRRLLATALLLSLPLASHALGAPNRAASKRLPLLVLASPAGERSVPVGDLKFVYFRTRYRHTRAPESESPTRERVEVIDKRTECACIRLADYSKIKMSNLREIEIFYPGGGRSARVRVTRENGRVNEYPIDELYRSGSLIAPRFSATVDGVVREFPLALRDDPEEAWPDEVLSRVLFGHPASVPPKKPKSP